MLSIAEVQCPHCGARGRLLLPSHGAILIGPCPQCQEMVAVFCGTGLPLEKEIMVDGSKEEKHAHLMEVLTSFLDRSIAQTLEQSEEGAQFEELTDDAVEDEIEEVDAGISDDELDQFRNVSLNMLDDKEYFEKVFRDQE